MAQWNLSYGGGDEGQGARAAEWTLRKYFTYALNSGDLQAIAGLAQWSDSPSDPNHRFSKLK